ncbi:hypothetical protein IC582_022648 [Cucumis melo]
MCGLYLTGNTFYGLVLTEKEKGKVEFISLVIVEKSSEVAKQRLNEPIVANLEVLFERVKESAINQKIVDNSLQFQCSEVSDHLKFMVEDCNLILTFSITL